MSDFLTLDIDECFYEVYPCDTNANCTNTNGSFSCTCQMGYTGSGITCEGKEILLNVKAIT